MEVGNDMLFSRYSGIKVFGKVMFQCSAVLLVLFSADSNMLFTQRMEGPAKRILKEFGPMNCSDPKGHINT